MGVKLNISSKHLMLIKILQANYQHILTSLSLFALMLSTPVHAHDNMNEEDFFTAIPVVVSATRQAQHITQAPASVTIISKEMINAMGPVNITDIFRLVPGYQSYSVNGSWFGVTSHGLSDKNPRRLEVRINGRSAYTALRSSISWASLGLTPDDIDHIEVVRGSNVPAYGSNAILGAINIITTSPLMESGTEFQVTTGSLETRNTNLSHAIQTNHSHSVIRASYQENNGFSHLEDDAYIGHITVHSLITPSLKDSISLEAGFSDANIGFGDGDHKDEFVDEYVDWGWLNINWERTGTYGLIKTHFDISQTKFDRSRKVLLSDKLKIDTSMINQLFPGQEDFFIEVEDGKRTYQQANIEIEHHYSATKSINIVWGGGIRYEELKNPISLGNSNYIDNAIKSFFTNTEWIINPYIGLNLGLMWEDVQIADDYLSPRLAINLHPLPNHHLRFSASKTSRAPSIYEAERFAQVNLSSGQELDLAYAAAPSLAEEIVRTYEIGYLGYWLNGKISLDYKLFREYMEGGIDGIKSPHNDIDGRVWHTDNTNYWRTSGFESQLQIHPIQNMLISIQYANIRVNGFREKRHKTDFRPLKSDLKYRVPNHTASALISYESPKGWVTGLTYYHNSYTDWRQGVEASSFARYDIHIEKNWLLGKQELEIGVTIQNVFDEDYLEYQDLNTFERRSFMNVKVKF